MKAGLKIYVLASYSIFQKIISRPRTKKVASLEKNNIVLLSISQGTVLAPKKWEKLSSVQNVTP